MEKATADKLDELIAAALYIAIEEDGEGSGDGDGDDGENGEEGENSEAGDGSPSPGNAALTLEKVEGEGEGEEGEDGEGEEGEEGEGEEGEGENEESRGEEPSKGAGGEHILVDVTQYAPEFSREDAYIGKLRAFDLKNGRKMNYVEALEFAKCKEASRRQDTSGPWQRYQITSEIRKNAAVFARATRFPIRAEAGKQSTTSGKFNPRKAHRLEMPDSLMMFRQPKAISAPSAEVVLLVDASGSTRMERYAGEYLLQHFMTTAAILYEAFKMIGVPCHVLGYGTYWADWVRGDAFTYNGISGGTGTDVAMQEAYRRLKDSTAKTRIIANLTDGEPDSGHAVGVATAFMQTQGIHTLGCLIMPKVGKKDMDDMKERLARYQYCGPATVVVGNNTQVYLRQIAEAMRYASAAK